MYKILKLFRLISYSLKAFLSDSAASVANLKAFLLPVNNEYFTHYESVRENTSRLAPQISDGNPRIISLAKWPGTNHLLFAIYNPNVNED